MTDKLKALKKSDFLAAISEEAMTRGQLVEVLGDDGYEFISSYIDYLLDHFEAQGKIELERDGDGAVTSIVRKGKKPATARDLFRVILNESDEGEGGYVIQRWTLGKGDYYNDEVKKAGWAQTPNAAAKKARSAVFVTYKNDVATINSLADVDEGEMVVWSPEVETEAEE